MHMPSSHESSYVWRIERQLEVLLPCPLATLEAMLPAGVKALTLVPGQGLLSVACIRFHPGNLGELPAFDELTLAISIESPAPERSSQFDFAAVVITSPCARFLELAASIDRMPTMAIAGLRFEWSDAQVRVADDEGPILELELTEPAPASALELDAHSLQTLADGTWLSCVRWSGHGALQGMPGCRHRVHAHRLWGTLPVAALGEQPVMALYAGPGEHSVTFAAPRRWSPPAADRPAVD
jgi:hypothetical protein